MICKLFRTVPNNPSIFRAVSPIEEVGWTSHDMNTSSLSLSVAQLATAQAQTQLETAVNVRVMKKANDLQAQAVQKLLSSMDIGQQIDITA